MTNIPKATNDAKWYQEHRTIWQIALLHFVFLIAAVAFLRPGGYLLASAPDQFFYVEIGNLASQGLFPYIHYWSEYPPVFPWIIVAAQFLSEPISNPDTSLFWFNNAMRWLMLPFETGTVLLIYYTNLKLGRSQRTALEAAVFYTLMFTPLFVFLGWFDGLSLFFLVLAMYGMAISSPILSGLAAGFGFSVKLFPIVALPAAVQRFKSEIPNLIKLGATTLIGAASVFLPFVFIAPQYTVAFFRTLQSRSSWETIWALLEGSTAYGIVAPLGQRTDPATAVGGVDTSVLPWGLITLAFASLGLFLWTRKVNWQKPLVQLSFTGLTFGIMLLYSRGYSPQWGIFLTAFALILLPGWRGLLYALVLNILTVLEWPVAFVLLGGNAGFLGTVIVLRTLLTIALCLEFACDIYPKVVWLRRLTRRPLIDDAAASQL